MRSFIISCSLVSPGITEILAVPSKITLSVVNLSAFGFGVASARTPIVYSSLFIRFYLYNIRKVLSKEVKLIKQTPFAFKVKGDGSFIVTLFHLYNELAITFRADYPDGIAVKLISLA